MKKQDIDNIDLKILAILQANAAITNKDLAARIELSPPPTLARVNALRAKGVIKRCHVQIDHGYLRYEINRMVVVAIRAEDFKEAFEAWTPMPWLSTICVTEKDVNTGNITITGHVIAPAEKDFEEFLERLRAFPRIIDVTIKDVMFTQFAGNTLITSEPPDIPWLEYIEE